MRVVFTRHAETYANTEGRFQGQMAAPAFGLSQRGREQAIALKNRFSTEGLVPTHFYTSPLQRCKETASVLTGLWRKEATNWDDLMERRTGIVTGLTLEEAKQRHPEVDFGPETARQLVGVPGAESSSECKERGRRVIRLVLQDHSSDAVVVMVSHGGILQHIISAMLDSPRAWNIEIRNTAVFDFWVDSTRWHDDGASLQDMMLWRIGCFNDASHLIP